MTSSTKTESVSNNTNTIITVVIETYLYHAVVETVYRISHLCHKHLLLLKQYLRIPLSVSRQTIRQIHEWHTNSTRFEIY